MTGNDLAGPEDGYASNLADGMRDTHCFVGWIAVAVIVRIVFWIIADRTWEDALITSRMLERGIEGGGRRTTR